MELKNAITLSEEEIGRVGAVAKTRAAADAQAKAFAPDGVVPAEGFDAHLQQSAAELVVAKHLGVPWDPTEVQSDGTAKVVGYHVRRLSGEFLLIYDSDPDEDIFIAARGDIPTFELAGWVRGAEGKARATPGAVSMPHSDDDAGSS